MFKKLYIIGLGLLSITACSKIQEQVRPEVYKQQSLENPVVIGSNVNGVPTLNCSSNDYISQMQAFALNHMGAGNVTITDVYLKDTANVVALFGRGYVNSTGNSFTIAYELRHSGNDFKIIEGGPVHTCSGINCELCKMVYKNGEFDGCNCARASDFVGSGTGVGSCNHTVTTGVESANGGLFLPCEPGA